MFQVKAILLLRIQVVFLTGTLPLILERELKSILHLEDLSIIRANCSRENISYKARPYKSYKEEERILEIRDYIEDFIVQEFLTKEDKILIFCPTINNVKLIASTLNYSQFTSDLSPNQKEETLNAFRSNNNKFYKVLVSTSALEEGFDYSFIRLVIYKDIGYSFIGFLQGSSRGGRDLKPSTSMFFYNAKDSNLNSSVISSLNPNTIEDKHLIYRYL